MTSAIWKMSSPPTVPTGPSPHVAGKDEKTAPNESVPVACETRVGSQEMIGRLVWIRPCSLRVVTPEPEDVGPVGAVL